MLRRRRLSTEEKCLRKTKFYQGMFRDVPPLSSAEYLERQGDESPPHVLVDVRTDPERQVSIIEGAVSLKQFESDLMPSLSLDTQVITYCTIGYRSGMEARRLRNRYGLDGRISSLDGIVSYTHAVEQAKNNATTQTEPSNIADAVRDPGVLNPSTGEATMAVHTFGGMWGCVQDEYRATHFIIPVLVLRLMQVSAIVVLRTGQRIVYNVRRPCRRRGTQPKRE